MACAQQQWLITRFLNDQLNDTKVRLQDAPAGLNAAAVNTYANLRTWTFIKDNWDTLVAK